MDDQVVAAGLDAGGLQLLGEQLGDLLDLVVPVVDAVGEVLPASADRRCDRGHRVERVGAGAHRLEARLQPNALLGGAGAGEVGVELVLLNLQQVGGRVVDGRPGPQSVGPVDQESCLVGGGHLERVEVVGRDPGDVVVDRLRCELHRGAGHGGGDLRHLDRPLRDGDGRLRCQHHARGESPRPTVNDPNGEAEVLRVGGALEHPVADAELLVANAFEAEVGVARPQLLGPAERGARHRPEGQVQEARIDGFVHEGEPIVRAQRGRSSRGVASRRAAGSGCVRADGRRG